MLIGLRLLEQNARHSSNADCISSTVANAAQPFTASASSTKTTIPKRGLLVSSEVAFQMLVRPARIAATSSAIEVLTSRTNATSIGVLHAGGIGPVSGRGPVSKR